MEFREWNLPSFLNNPIQLILSFGSETLSTDPSVTVLCGLGFILLSLYYLVGMLSAPTRGKVQYSNRVRTPRKTPNRASSQCQFHFWSHIFK